MKIGNISLSLLITFSFLFIQEIEARSLSGSHLFELVSMPISQPPVEFSDNKRRKSESPKQMMIYKRDNALKRILRFAYIGKLTPNQAKKFNPSKDQESFNEIFRKLSEIFQIMKHEEIQDRELEEVFRLIMIVSKQRLSKQWLIEPAVAKVVQTMSIEELANFESHVIRVTK